MLNRILRSGFARANGRLGFVLIDLIWKAVWFGGTLGAVLLAVSVYSSRLQSLEWQDTGVPGLNDLLALTLVQEFWNRYWSELFWSIAAVLATACGAWLILEALFRSRLARTNSFRVFFLSGAAKLAVLAAAAFILCLISFGAYFTTPVAEWPLLWAEARGAAAAAAVAFVGLAFFVTILETLMRSDATVLLGTDLIQVSAAVGTLLLFEAMIDASILIVIFAGFLNVSGLPEFTFMLGAAGVSVVVMSVLHSYLLLVRFSAVETMRQNQQLS